MIKTGIASLSILSVLLLLSACKDQCFHNGHEFVDLGLSVKWATCNIGAEKPEDYGDYFAWGETETYYEPSDAETGNGFRWKEGKGWRYEWKSYFDIETITPTDYEDMVTFKKYKTLDKLLIDPEDDAAHVNWGGDWRMPTKAELDELTNSQNCSWTWTTVNNVKGYKVTSRKPGYEGNYIFLPAAGLYTLEADYLLNGGFEGFYWSSSIYDKFSDKSTSNAYSIYFKNVAPRISVTGRARCFGCAIRPVCP